MDDTQLLQQLTPALSPDAVAALVARHAPLVHSACLRQLRDPALADQATQAVFLLLTRDPTRLAGVADLTPWLFDTAHRICRAALPPSPGTPGEGRAEGLFTSHRTAGDWSHLSPHIDQALASLSRDARDAVLLKYLTNRPLRDVANALGISDTAAGQRISAGVAGLRAHFESLDHPISPEALVAAIQARAVQPAPAIVIRNAIGAALTPHGAPPPPAAGALARAAATAARRERTASLAVTASLLLLLAAGSLALLAAVKRARLAAATQTTTAPSSTTNSPTSPGPVAQQRPDPVMPAMPEKAPPPARPEKPLDPELVSRFLSAIRQSDYEAVQALVDREPAIVNARDPKTGRPAVQVAADLVMWRRQDATRIAHFLIESGARTDIFTAARAGHRDYVAYTLLLARNLLDARDPDGLTALQRAALVPGASPECEEVADMLMGAGAKIDLWTACTFARAGDVEQCIADDPKLVNEPRLGATPLNWAVRPRRYPENPIAIPRLLIEKGADVRTRDTANDGMTPLHHAAAWGGQVPVAQLLLDRGVDVNLPDDYGWTPLDYAIDRGKKEMIDFLQSKGGRRTTVDYPDQPSKTPRFFAAVQFGDADLVKRLLDDTPELAKSRGPTGETPLHWAAATGSLPIIDLILADHADIDAQETNKYGGPPLHWAAQHDQPAAVKHLLAKGADPKIINPRNAQSALHVAAQHTDDAALIDLLLTAGLDPTLKDRFNKTPLDYAQQAGHNKVAAKLKAP